MYNFNLSIIIPCLNESKNLTKLIPEIKKNFKEIGKTLQRYARCRIYS